jgi:hypothetical protein
MSYPIVRIATETTSKHIQPGLRTWCHLIIIACLQPARFHTVSRYLSPLLQTRPALTVFVSTTPQLTAQHSRTEKRVSLTYSFFYSPSIHHHSRFKLSRLPVIISGLVNLVAGKKSKAATPLCSGWVRHKDCSRLHSKGPRYKREEECPGLGRGFDKIVAKKFDNKHMIKR